eukprot:34659-Eustigmatos_ZCMA.PRE.1
MVFATLKRDTRGTPLFSLPSFLPPIHINRTHTRIDTYIYSHTRQPLEIFVDDETKLTLHGLQQYYIKLTEDEKNRKLNELLDALEFNQ